MFRSVGVAVWGWICALRCLPLPSTWWPLMVLVAVEVAALLILRFFYVTGLAPWATPLVSWLGNESATHYPQHLFQLPAMMADARTWLGLAVGSLLLAAATAGFGRAFGATLPAGWLRRGWIHLWILAGIPVLAHWGLGLLFATIPPEIREVSTIVRLAMIACHQVLGVVVHWILVFATAWVVFRGLPFWSALANSTQLATRTFITSALLVIGPAVLHFPLVLMLSGLKQFAIPMAPEGILMLLLVQVALGFLVTLLMVGSVTRVFLLHTERAR